MEWILNLTGSIWEKIRQKVKCRITPEFLLSAMVVMIGLVLLIPIVIAGFYNHMSGDDWFCASFVNTQMRNGFSLFGLISDLTNELIDLYTRWSFTYSGNFLCYLMPAGFGDNFTWLHTVLLLGNVVICMYLFGMRVFKRTGIMDKWSARIATVLVITMLIQSLPSAFDAFYWLSGSVNNTVGFAISILGIAFLLKLYKDEEKVKKSHWVFFGIGLFTIAGTSYASVLVLFCSMVLVLIDMWVYKKATKNQRIIYTALFAFYVLCIIFAMTAPGNTARGGNIDSEGAGVVFSILKSYISGVSLLLNNIDLFTIGVVLIVALLAAPGILKSKYDFRCPLVVMFVVYSIYITSFIPTYYAQGNSGALRVQNIQYWYAMFFLIISALYCMGWYFRYKGISEMAPVLSKYRLEVLFVLICVSMLLMIKGGDEPISKTAFRELTDGTIQQFDQELDERESLYHQSAGEDLVITPVSGVPDLFEGYTDLLEDKEFWINYHVQKYYRLNSVTCK